MNKYYIIPLLLTGILTLTACDDSDRLDVEDINIPRGYALSAGTSTGFYISIFPEAMRCLLVHRQDSITLLSLTTRQPHGSLVLMPHGLMPEIVCMTT